MYLNMHSNIKDNVMEFKAVGFIRYAKRARTEHHFHHLLFINVYLFAKSHLLAEVAFQRLRWLARLI